ncbi:hypothetical protein Tco_0669850 [Tanacetum coccineum]
MDGPNITMKEYIRLEEEKARKRRKVFNWKTAKYGKIWYDEDIHDLRSVNDEVSSKTLSCEPTVSSLNDEIDFRISFDDSDDEDYMVIFEKNSFSYKIISTNDLKTDSENDNEKVMPLLPSPEPAVSCLDDLDFLKDFENEFPAIVYNDAPTSKSDLLTKPIFNPQHIDEFDLNDETSLSEYDEEEQKNLYFNDLLPFNIIHADDLKSEKDNDDNDIDIIQSSRDMALLPRDQRHQYLRYEGLQYTDADIEDLESRMLMEHKDAQGQSVFTSRAWRRIFDIRGPLVHELILEFFSTFRIGEAIHDLDTPRALQFQLGGAKRHLSWRKFIIPDKGDLRDYWTGISAAVDFLGTAPSYTAILDLILRLCHRLIACSIVRRIQALEKVTVTDLFYLRGMDVDSVNVLYLLARYLRLFVAGRKSGAHIFGGLFVARLAEHFRLLTAEILQGLTVIAPVLLVIDMAELITLQIYEQLDDTWAWTDPAPVQAPPPPPLPVAARTKFIARLAEHFGLLTAEILGGLTIIAPKLPVINMVELVTLQIYEQLHDTWVWVAMGPERQPDAAAGAPGVAQDAPVIDEGGQADPAPVQAPPPPAAARTMP